MVQPISEVDVPVNRPGQRAVAVASSISLVCIFCAFWSWMPSWYYGESFHGTDHWDRFPGLACILPFWIPYGFVLLRLYQGRIKSGLVLAATMGCALFVPVSSYFALLSNGKEVGGYKLISRSHF